MSRNIQAILLVVLFWVAAGLALWGVVSIPPLIFVYLIAGGLVTFLVAILSTFLYWFAKQELPRRKTERKP